MLGPGQGEEGRCWELRSRQSRSQNFRCEIFMGLWSRCYFRAVKARGVCEPQEEAYSNATFPHPRPDRPTDAHHVHTHTRSLTHTNTAELESTCRHANTHGSHTQEDAPPNTCVCSCSHGSPPMRCHTHRPQPLQTTQSHTPGNRRDFQGHPVPPPPML